MDGSKNFHLHTKIPGSIVFNYRHLIVQILFKIIIISSYYILFRAGKSEKKREKRKKLETLAVTREEAKSVPNPRIAKSLSTRSTSTVSESVSNLTKPRKKKNKVGPLHRSLNHIYGSPVK